MQIIPVHIIPVQIIPVQIIPVQIIPVQIIPVQIIPVQIILLHIILVQIIHVQIIPVQIWGSQHMTKCIQHFLYFNWSCRVMSCYFNGKSCNETISAFSFNLEWIIYTVVQVSFQSSLTYSATIAI